MDPEVQGLKVIIDCPQLGSSWVTYRPAPITRWSKCGGNDKVMVLLGSGTSKVSKETQPEWRPSPTLLSRLWCVALYWRRTVLYLVYGIRNITAGPCPSSAVVLNHILFHFLISLSDSSLICAVPVQWLIILVTIIVITLNIYIVKENWRRPPGHPHTTWMKSTQKNLELMNLSLNEIIDVAQNHPFWRMMSTFCVMHS